MVKYQDSLYKIASYLEGLASKPFTLNDIQYKPPKRLYISNSLFRDYLCLANCGGCCRGFTLVYFQHNIKDFLEKYPQFGKDIKEVKIKVNGIKKKVYSLKNDFTIEKREFKGKIRENYDQCQYLDDQKRCMIHEANPLSCRFELKKVTIDKERNRTILGKKMFGRAWQMNPPYGALCEMKGFTIQGYENDLRDLRDLKYIADDFGITHNVDKVLSKLEEFRGKLEKGILPKSGLLLVATNKY